MNTLDGIVTKHGDLRPVGMHNGPHGEIALTGQMEEIFSTPMFCSIVKGSEELNASLAELILAKELSDPSAVKSDMVGWQSAPDLFMWGGLAVKTLERCVRQALSDATAEVSDKGPLRAKFDISGWAAVSRRGHYNTVHLHPMSTWSGVYYVDPGDEEPDSPGACLEFPHPIAASSMSLFPGVFPSARFVRPAAGTLLLFPSYLLHSVQIYRGDRPRIRVPFNAQLRGIDQTV